MNGGYYQNPIFPGSTTQNGIPTGQGVPTIDQNIIGGMIPDEGEQSYIENILRLNKGKVAKFYMSFPDSNEWRDKVFTGTIEAAGRDHIIVADPNSGLRHLLRIIYLDYVDFEEAINYSPIYGQTYNQTR